MNKLAAWLGTIVLLTQTALSQNATDETIYGVALGQSGVVIKESMISDRVFPITSSRSGKFTLTLKKYKLDFQANSASQYLSRFCVGIELEDHGLPGSGPNVITRLDMDEIEQLIFLSKIENVEDNMSYSFSSKHYGKIKIKSSKTKFHLLIGMYRQYGTRQPYSFNKKEFLKIVEEIEKL